MMSQVPYEKLVPEANRYLQKMTSAQDLQTINYWWDIYVSFLEAAGWDPISFDKETLKRVDEGWNETKSNNLN